MAADSLPETRALFQALVGRAADPEEMIRLEGDPESLRHSLLRSDSYLRARGQRENTPNGIFNAEGDAGAPRIGVISNCQGPELARWLALATGASTIGVEVMAYDPTHRDAFLSKFAACDWILAAPFQSQVFRGLSPDEIVASIGSRVIAIPSLNFSGLQPDIVQLGEMNARLPAVLGGHSRLVVSGYLRGLGVEATLDSFREEVFASFDFFERWTVAEDELRRREQGCDVKIADDLLALCRREPAMFTENHPTTSVYVQFARRVAELIGLPFREIPIAMLPPNHALSTAWPVYDEIAAYHRLPYRTTQLYSTLDEMMSRRQLVERSFALYDSFDRDALASVARAREIPI